MTALWKVNLKDLLHGLIVAVLTAVLTLIVQMLQAGGINWTEVGLLALTTTLSYILKQLATDEQGKVLGKV